ncbi:hypothetical protein B0T17DRAFT_489837 [Bombardia bombarda]|uniref:Zn(2)-C6 fungal-type domain-containing protein n=1 Tax=Bombardia bombarda TaxID=252184 RepID=A0AA39X9F6_9PEZI|nr:hypothetical protein B0T17DRAFT_489837 [Bombardia bombarda]
MQAFSHWHDDSRIPLGQRRGITDLARFALDLTWARADSESAARSESYPSPPMSGSPPLPPKTSQEAAERNQGVYQATTQDVYRGISTTQREERVQTTAAAAVAAVAGGVSVSSRGFASDAPERPYAFHRTGAPTPRPLHYPQQHNQAISQQSYLPPVPGPSTPRPLTIPPGFPAVAHHPAQESQHQTSPKPQRKTKGHVASACVPCKRAHLRCDAQRPCSRCSTNGKEDACVDVQHKKRGRPRLRDDRELKYDNARFGSAPDPMRRPIPSVYGGPGSSMGMTYEDTLRRPQSHSYRVLKSQPAEPIAPRFLERGSASDANIFPAPLSISTRPPEPAAFLTVDLKFTKASNTFREAIGRLSVDGLNLVDLAVPGDREKISVFQRQIQEERARKDPNYLPPIYGKEEEERLMQKLGFGAEELSRYTLDWHEFLTFLTHDGQPRQISFRMGLAKQDSIYFIVLLLIPRSFQYLTPSPRDIAYTIYQPVGFSQPTPVSATFDLRQPRLGEGGYGGARQIAPPNAPPQILSGLSPGLPSSYAASPSRLEYPAATSSYQVPRSELHPASRAPQAPGYQLPPIRSQQLGAPRQQQDLQYQTREERPRVDIGGLIDRLDPSKHPQQQQQQQQQPPPQ